MITYISIEALDDAISEDEAYQFKCRIYRLVQSVGADVEDYIVNEGLVTIGITGEFNENALLSSLEKLTGCRRQEFTFGKEFDLFMPDLGF